MQIFVDTLGPSETLTLDVAPDATVGDLRATINERAGSGDGSSLYFAGHELQDDRRTLSDYNIQQQSTIRVMLRLRGGGGGGGGYDRAVVQTQGTYSTASNAVMRQRSLHADCSPVGKTLTTASNCPIVLAVDVTGSMGNWSKVMYDKMPMFYGQLLTQGYAEGPDICFAGIGDATTDQAPLQVTKFAKGIDIDEEIKKLWLEGGGGDRDWPCESYELAA